MTWTGEHPLAATFAVLEAALSEVRDSRASTFSPASAQAAVSGLLRLRHQAEAAHLHLLRVLGETGSSRSQTTRFLSGAPNLLSRAQAHRDVDAAVVTDPSVGGVGRGHRWGGRGPGRVVAPR